MRSLTQGVGEGGSLIGDLLKYSPAYQLGQKTGDLIVAPSSPLPAPAPSNTVAAPPVVPPSPPMSDTTKYLLIGGGVIAAGIIIYAVATAKRRR